MPSATFQNLNLEKKNHINDALLTEFSNHSLASAQVARIVKQAAIARGAFYKYFDNLQDAYQYLYHVAIKDIHTPITRANHLLTADDYVKQIRDFVDEINGSRYRDFMKLHFQTNEGLLRDESNPMIKPHGALEWGVMVLSHETIKDCLLQPAKQDEAIERLAKALSALLQ
ncbi:TetR/AcrR family transcriptional regulator [Limosilactobacillus sp. STM2_1]|uniref:TetR/AcrR family transcriptional regulator n=1 Tax=Limosilactobacillus rudii TaxID=2759755 RepID=A0A7W3ULJ5_9LACO|nr:TetR/AcrR family transcriptional regulator [Limosilactobacillus rudii]MBB1079623.1 TetR/AcrR family transcriptional regulator [Limosilactobacillus rudii]MBB1097701.1 TetR/AcrR family transcriptional regulator [Limosilactobacillus rudii]MCD7134387.1 TetR/AcrR family transcriptional regulator [Limosilactobacillus rudii]